MLSHVILEKAETIGLLGWSVLERERSLKGRKNGENRRITQLMRKSAISRGEIYSRVRMAGSFTVLANRQPVIVAIFCIQILPAFSTQVNSTRRMLGLINTLPDACLYDLPELLLLLVIPL
jgi:hypothetical protein